MKKEKKGKKALLISPEKIAEGKCVLQKARGQRYSICKEKGKIKIFEVEKEK